MNQPPAAAVTSKESAAEKPSDTTAIGKVKVSQSKRIITTRVSPIKSVRLPANYSATVPVQISQVKGHSSIGANKVTGPTPTS